MPFLRTFAFVAVLLTTPLLAVPLLAQAPGKTPMQQASPIVDTLAARVNKLQRDVEAAGADAAKVRALTEKYRQDNERLETQLAGIKQQMKPDDAAELEVYTQLKMGKAPEKLKAALDKAAKEAAEVAAKVGPATVAKYRETTAQYAEEGASLVKRMRDAGTDAGKREQAWQALVAWDGKRHQLVHQIRRDPNVVEPKVLTEEAEEALQPLAVHATRLHRLGAQPACAELQKELAIAPGRAKPIADLEPLFQKVASASQLHMAKAQLTQAREAALEVSNAELTRDEADEVRDTVAEAIAPVLMRLKEAEMKASARFGKGK